MSKGACGKADSGTSAHSIGSSELQLTLSHYSPDGKLHRDPFVLRDLYVVHGLTTTRMGELLGVNHGSISHWMDKHEIAVADGRRQENGVKHPELADRESLQEMYHGEMLKASEIADRLGCSESLVNYWMGRHDIDARTKSDYRGSRSATYNGGPTGNVYQYIRDSYMDACWVTYTKHMRGAGVECVLCGSTRTGGQAMNIHHIVPVMAGGTNGDYNLMPLCKSCHVRVESFTEDLLEKPILDAIKQAQNS